MRNSAAVALVAAILAATAWWWWAREGGRDPAGEASATEAAGEGAGAGATRTVPAPGAPGESARPDAPPSGPSVTGRVVDESGAPVGGAAVRAVPPAESPADEEPPGTTRATASADGSFRAGMPVGAARASLVVTAHGFAPAALDVGAGDVVTVTLRRGAALHGSVLDEDGEAVAAARVSVVGPVAGRARARTEADSRTDGAYRVEGIPRAWESDPRVRIEVRAAGFAPLLLAPGSAQFAAWGGGGSPLPRYGLDARQDFVLVRPAAVRGRVLRAEDDTPLADARVVAWWEGVHWPGSSFPGSPDAGPERVVLAETRSASDGAFALHGLPAKGTVHAPSVVLGASAEGRAVAILRLGDAAPGTLTDRDLVLEPAGSAEGRVLRADGTPAEGAVVTAFFGRAGLVALPPEVAPRALADAHGRYRIDGLPAPAGRRGTVMLRATLPLPDVRGWPRADVPVEVTAATVAAAPDIRLVERPVLSALVVVRDAAGAPVRGATVGGFGPVDADGRWLFRWSLHVPPSLPVPVSAPGYATATAELLLAAEPAEHVVTLEPAVTLEGVVLDSAGVGVPGAWVHVFAPEVDLRDVESAISDDAPEDGPSSLRSTTSGPAGRFRFEDLPAGAFGVLATAPQAPTFTGGSGPSIRPAQVVVRAEPGGGVTLRLPWAPPPPFAGEVVDASTDRPLRGGFAAQLLGEREQVGATSVESGRFVFENYPPGAWRLRVHADGYAPMEPIAVDLSGGVAPPAVRVALVPVAWRRAGVEVRGTLSSPEGLDLAGAYVHLTPRGPPSAYQKSASTMLDGRGRFTLHEVRAGPYVLSVSGAAGEFVAAGNARVEVPEGAPPPPVEREVVRCGTLLVRVRGPVAPAPDAEEPPNPKTDPVLRVLDAAGDEVERGVVSRHAGAWHLFRLAPGKYVARLEDDGILLHERAAEVTAGGGVTVEW